MVVAALAAFDPLRPAPDPRVIGASDPATTPTGAYTQRNMWRRAPAWDTVVTCI